MHKNIKLKLSRNYRSGFSARSSVLPSEGNTEGVKYSTFKEPLLQFFINPLMTGVQKKVTHT